MSETSDGVRGLVNVSGYAEDFVFTVADCGLFFAELVPDEHGDFEWVRVREGPLNVLALFGAGPRGLMEISQARALVKEIDEQLYRARFYKDWSTACTWLEELSGVVTALLDQRG